MSISELKFSEEEIAAKSITSLADRPTLSAEEMKERLDSGDIRVKVNALIDGVEPTLDAHTDQLNRLMVFETADMNAVLRVLTIIGKGKRFFAFFLDNGRIFCGNSEELQAAVMNGELK